MAADGHRRSASSWHPSPRTAKERSPTSPKQKPRPHLRVLPPLIVRIGSLRFPPPLVRIDPSVPLPPLFVGIGPVRFSPSLGEGLESAQTGVGVFSRGRTRALPTRLRVGMP